MGGLVSLFLNFSISISNTHCSHQNGTNFNSFSLLFVSASILSCKISTETPPKSFLVLWVTMAIQKRENQELENIPIIKKWSRIVTKLDLRVTTVFFRKSTWLLLRACIICCQNLRGLMLCPSQGLTELIHMPDLL